MNHQLTGHFTIGTRMPGAITFTCALTLEGGHVVGIGALTQAIHPALDIHTYLAGTSVSILWGADDTQVISLTGHTWSTPMPPNPVNVTCTMQLDSKTPGRGVASVRYLDAQGVWIPLENLPVHGQWQRAPE